MTPYSSIASAASIEACMPGSMRRALCRQASPERRGRAARERSAAIPASRLERGLSAIPVRRAREAALRHSAFACRRCRAISSSLSAAAVVRSFFPSHLTLGTCQIANFLFRGCVCLLGTPVRKGLKFRDFHPPTPLLSRAFPVGYGPARSGIVPHRYITSQLLRFAGVLFA